MKLTFDEAIPSDRDWVRLESGDWKNGKMVVADQTIEYILREEPNKYFAAARVCEIILAERSKTRGGMVEKEVDELRIRWASGSSEDDYRKHINWLRERGAELTAPVGRRVLDLM